jgi:hypothetical protein
VTGTERAAEPATEKDTVVLSAVRRKGRWITRAGAHGIVVHGRTLRDLRASAQQAMTLRFGTAAPPVQVRPQSAGLDELAAARRGYDEALCQAVQTLRADGVAWAEVAQVCGVRIADAQAALCHAVPARGSFQGEDKLRAKGESLAPACGSAVPCP